MKIEVLERHENPKDGKLPYELVREVYNNGTSYLAVRPLVKKDSTNTKVNEQEEVTEVIDKTPKKKKPKVKKVK